MRSISAGVNAPFLTSRVLVFQLRIIAMRRPGSLTPDCRSASIAVAISFTLSRGGILIQRVMASNPPVSRSSRYLRNASTV